MSSKKTIRDFYKRVEDPFFDVSWAAEKGGCVTRLCWPQAGLYLGNQDKQGIYHQGASFLENRASSLHRSGCLIVSQPGNEVETKLFGVSVRL